MPSSSDEKTINAAAKCGGEICAFFCTELKSVYYSTGISSGKWPKWQYLASTFSVFLETDILAMVKSTAKVLSIGGELGFDDCGEKRAAGTDWEGRRWSRVSLWT